MLRLMLTDTMWEKLRKNIELTSAHLTENLRTVIEGILWRFRVGAPWRDLPDYFGPWKTVYNRFNEWSKSGVWRTIFEMLKSEPDNEWNFIDGTYIKAHQHASGGVENAVEKTIGRSKGGNTSKVHMLTDSHGNPIGFKITGGNVHDLKIAPELVKISEGDNIIGDKGYDSDGLRDVIFDIGAIPHIPRKSNSKNSNDCFDRELYRHRHLVENLFAKLKHFRAFATRFDKLSRNFYSTVSIGCLIMWLKL